MIREGYHYVINYVVLLAIAFINIDPVYPGSCARGSIPAGELREIWF